MTPAAAARLVTFAAQRADLVALDPEGADVVCVGIVYGEESTEFSIAATGDRLTLSLGRLTWDSEARADDVLEASSALLAKWMVQINSR